MKKIIYIIIAYFLFLIPIEAQEQEIVNIYLFHTEKCPHCKEEIKFLELLEKRNRNIRIYKYEISNTDNEKILKEAEKIYNKKINSTPITIIGDKFYKGYSKEKSPAKIITTINYYSIYGYEDKLGEKVENIELPKLKTTKNRVDIEKYIKENSNYKIMFNINSEDIALNSISTLLGVKASINVINILALVVIIILIEKKQSKEQIILYGIYTISIIIYEAIDYIINKNLTIMIIYIIFISFLTALKVIKKKKNYYSNYIFIIVGLSLIIRNFIELSEISLLKKIIEINLLSTLELIANITTYLFSYISINILIILGIKKIKTNLMVKTIK